MSQHIRHDGAGQIPQWRDTASSAVSVGLAGPYACVLVCDGVSGVGGRTSTREAGLRTVLSALRAYSCVDVLQANKETTMANLVPLIKRAGNSEGQLLAQALGLVMLLLGPEEDAAFAEIMAPLEFVVTRSSHADYRVEVRGAQACSTAGWLDAMMTNLGRQLIQWSSSAPHLLLPLLAGVLSLRP